MADGTATRALDTLPVDPAWLSVPVGFAAAGAVLTGAPLPTGAARMLAITVFCVALWVATPVRPWFTALLGIGLIGVVFEPSLALTGFQNPATWLVVVGWGRGDGPVTVSRYNAPLRLTAPSVDGVIQQLEGWIEEQDS